jgi:hypothetical protein
MIHTSNLPGSGGLANSPIPGQPVNTSGPDVATGRPAARKSQIIEEEEDIEGIEEETEEVDEFDEPGTPAGLVAPSEHPADENGSPSSPRTPFAPIPALETSPLRPPRSSSLRSPTDAADKIGIAE